MTYYAYKITRDYGFAPNPFFGYCTLACCKPHIRDRANTGDWIIGTGAIENHLLNHLIFLMRVTEKMTFEDYWNDQRFHRKKPVLNGSLKQIHGDNIYYKENDTWCQLDSHHSLHDGVQNEENKKQDLGGNSVLISDQFVYLGNNSFFIPPNFRELCPTSKQRDYIKIINETLAQQFVELVFGTYPKGLNGEPNNWVDYSQRTLF